MKSIAKQNLSQLLECWSGDRAVYLPVDTAAGADYALYTEGVTMSGALNTNRSAKDFFFPQTENLMDFAVEGKTIDIKPMIPEDKPFVVFGVRACDARSFSLLDNVFLTDPVDSYYEKRRSLGAIVTMACDRPAETCFCTTFDIDPANPGGDVACWMDDDTVYLTANTPVGEQLLAAADSLLADGDEGKVEEIRTAIGNIMERLPIRNLPMGGFTEANLLNLFSDEKWAELSRSCLGCGTCTFVCPTCQCYDIKDFDTGHGVRRFRCWDSCMYSEFTRCAHGNPRLSQLERFRQRFMHKLVYYPANNGGVYSCVGCGRCLAKCPISMNIVKVIKALGGGNND